MSKEFNSHALVSGVTTVVVKTGSGVLKSIAVTSLAIGGVIAIYDNTSAAMPAIASLSVAGIAATTPYSIDFRDIAFTKGLTVKTTVKSQNLTVTFE